jgi:hypothetical protein
MLVDQCLVITMATALTTGSLVARLLRGTRKQSQECVLWTYNFANIPARLMGPSACDDGWSGLSWWHTGVTLLEGFLLDLRLHVTRGKLAEVSIDAGEQQPNVPQCPGQGRARRLAQGGAASWRPCQLWQSCVRQPPPGRQLGVSLSAMAKKNIDEMLTALGLFLTDAARSGGPKRWLIVFIFVVGNCVESQSGNIYLKAGKILPRATGRRRRTGAVSSSSSSSSASADVFMSVISSSTA